MKNELGYVKDNMVTKAEHMVTKAELKTEIAEAKSELKIEIAELRTAIKDSHNNLLRWIISLFITMIIGFFVPLFLK